MAKKKRLTAKEQRDQRRAEIKSQIKGEKWEIAVTDLNNWPHYTFFSSLAGYADKKSVIAGRTQGSPYSQIYSQGQAYMNQIAGAIGATNLEDTTQEATDLIQHYLNFLLQLANDARAAEQAYLQRKKKEILDEKNGIPPEIRKQIELLVFSPIKSGDTVDYQSLLATFQYAMGSTYTRRNQELQYVLDQMVAQEQVIQKLKTSLDASERAEYDALKQAFEHSRFKEFNRILRNHDADQITSPAEKIAEQISKLIDKLNDDTGFRQKALLQISQLFGNQITAEQACDILKIYIIEYIESFDFATIINTSIDNLFVQFKSNLEKQNIPLINPQAMESIQNILGSQKDKNLANILIRGHSVGSKFGTHKGAISEANQRAIIEKLYNSSALTQAEKDYLLQNLDKTAQVSRILNRAIMVYAENEWFNQGHRAQHGIGTRATSAEQRLALIEEMGEDTFRQLIQPLEDLRRQNLLDTIQVSVQLPGFMHGEIRTVSELISSDDIQTAIYAGGQVIQTKADIQVVWSFDKETFLSRYKKDGQAALNASLNKLYPQLNSLLQQEEREFQQLYTTKAKGATDVRAAMEAKLESLKHLKEILTKQISDDGSTAIKIIEDLIFGEISIKEYKYGTNEFGFHAGALGAGDRVGPVIHNIMAMYEAGGLTVPDEQMLIDAVINCGSDELGSGLQESISNLLLGAAAMILFDQGFGQTSGFQDRIKSELGLARGTTQMTLIKANTTYIPASFLYMTIYNQLQKVYNGNLFDKRFANVKSSVVIHNVDESIKPNWLEVKSAPQRWEIVRKIAEEETTIELQFLSGLIDIIQAIQQAFEVPT